MVNTASGGHLFGSHVSRCSHDLMGGCQGSRLAVVAKDSRESKVGNLDAALTGHQDVFGFDVAMNDAFVMCKLKRIAQVWNDGQRVLWRELLLANDLAKCGSVDKFHQEVIRLAGFAKLVDRNNLGMI